MQLPGQEAIAGTIIGGKYRLDRVIGRGGMATVYAAVHTWTGRAVAVKLLHSIHAADSSLVERFLQEARTSVSLRHPNVVEVLDMGADDQGRVFMTLELLSGENLAAMLDREKKLDCARMLELLLPVMDALALAHARGIIHRDLKPQNIFISKDASGRLEAKLLDFGIAKVLDDPQGKRTQAGTLIGTPQYMAPEQLSSKLVSAASDVWAMGIVVYECLTGSQPFEGRSLPSIFAAIEAGAIRPIDHAAPDVPAPIAHVIQKALARDRAQRYPSMREFAAALRTASAEALLRVASPVPSAPVSSMTTGTPASAQRFEAPQPSLRESHRTPQPRPATPAQLQAAQSNAEPSNPLRSSIPKGRRISVTWIIATGTMAFLAMVAVLFALDEKGEEPAAVVPVPTVEPLQIGNAISIDAGAFAENIDASSTALETNLPVGASVPTRDEGSSVRPREMGGTQSEPTSSSAGEIVPAAPPTPALVPDAGPNIVVAEPPSTHGGTSLPDQPGASRGETTRLPPVDRGW